MFTEIEKPRCGNHQIVNVLDRLPKQPQAEARALRDSRRRDATRGRGATRRRHRALRHGVSRRRPRFYAPTGSAGSPAMAFRPCSGRTCARLLVSSHPSRPCACEHGGDARQEGRQHDSADLAGPVRGRAVVSQARSPAVTGRSRRRAKYQHGIRVVEKVNTSDQEAAACCVAGQESLMAQGIAAHAAGDASQRHGPRPQQMALGQSQTQGLTFFDSHVHIAVLWQSNSFADQGLQCCTWS